MVKESKPEAATVAAATATEKPAAAVRPTPAAALASMASLLEGAVRSKETRLLSGRIMRLAAAVRKELTPDVLRAFITGALSEDASLKAPLLAAIAQVQPAGASAMDTDGADTAALPAPPALTPSSTPELELFAVLLTLMHLLDHNLTQQAKELSVLAVERLAVFNRRTMDVIAARIYSYYQLAHERLGQMAAVRSSLLALHRTAHLRHDVIGQETLLNLLLRNYLHYNQYDQAEKFRSKAQRGDLFRSHHQYVRYLHYLGRIQAVQLEYTGARDCLQQAARKCPAGALSFRILTTKWLILVRLLLGEVPERAEFSVPGLATPLRPYFQLTQAVRSGDLVAFDEVAKQHDAVFRADGVRNLVLRLHHNVIRTGLRRISLAYSRISMADVAARLHIPSVDDAACIVAKAIRDGAIDAVIDHEAGAMVSRDTQDVYVSSEPAEAFHVRVAFCLDLHNEAVKALRYEPDSHKRKLESAKARAERLAAEAELAAALEEDGDE